MAHTCYKNIQCQKCLRYTVKTPEPPPARDKLWNQAFLFFLEPLLTYIPLDFPVYLQVNVNICVFIILVIHLFLAALGLCCRTQAFSSCYERGLHCACLRGLLLEVTSLVSHGL